MPEANGRRCPEQDCDGVMEDLETSDGDICDSCGHVESDRYSGGALDLTMSTGPWAGDGETVATSDETSADGSVKLEDWPSAVDADPADVTDKRETVVRTAARYPQFNGKQVAEEAGVSDSCVSRTLNELWPERVGDKGHVDIDGQEVRRRALNGESAADIADDINLAQSSVRRYISGRRGDGGDIPPLEYDMSAGAWKLPDDAASDEDTPGPSATPANGEAVGEEKSDENRDVEQQLNQAEASIKEAAEKPDEEAATPGVDAGGAPVLGDHERAEAMLALTATEVQRLARGEMPPELADAVLDGLMQESGIVGEPDGD